MKVFRRFSKIFGAFLLVAAMLSGTVAPALAAEDERPEYRLQISPASQDIGELKPGATYTGSLKVQNTGTKAFEFKVYATPYSVKDEDYSPDYTTETNYSTISNWITFSEESGTVESDHEKEITFTIKVPTDVAAGGQYAMIAVEMVNNEEVSGSTGVSAIRRVGMLLYANIEGQTRKTGSVVENKVPSFLFKPPVSVTSIVENIGNTHAKVKYVLQVYPLFGDEEVFTNEEDPVTVTLLPETRRFNTLSWEGAPQLGIFRVKQTISFWDEISTTEKIVFLCPIWFLFIILLLIFLIIFWIVSRIRSRRDA